MAATAIGRAAGAAAAMLLALCAGAIWAVVALILGDDVSWMAAPTALVVLYAISSTKVAARPARAAAALVLYAAAVVYAQYLHSASVVASQLGIGFYDALSGIGPEMAYALATARGGVVDGVTLGVVALALALVAARWT
ncbi:MAG TPA: hypothetical protein VND91_05690 [Candidatus Saccharimonadia bacterium]|nr:hypothetical protein [Candidatus Saccharimonadia bacterium]